MLLRSLVEYLRCSYEKLRAMIGDAKNFDAVGRSGTQYQIEVDFVWDDQPGGNIRILGAIDDGGWRACCPLGYSALVSPPPERH